jgi:hypothetical protein
MSEIKFRGKRLKDGTWVYGLPTQDVNEHYRIQYDPRRFSVVIDPDTGGQYTGVRDKNGKEIWEGDIFKDDRGVVRSVFRVPGGFAFEDDPVSFGYDHRAPVYPYSPIADPQNVSWLAQCCEVIGNIHDNTELLKTE